MILLYVFILLGLLERSFACYEKNVTEEIPTTTGRQICDPNRCYYTYTMNITRYNTIICKNLYSIGQISYSYKIQDFDQFLIITDSNVSTIQTMELHKFSTIAKLYLSQLRIQKIVPGAFAGLTRLRELYLNDNELTELLNGVYNHLNRLEILNFTNNRIHTIEDRALIGVSALTQLHLRNNNLTIIEDSFFETMNHLKNLDISENPLVKFPFNKLSNIDSLLLSKTEIADMTTDLSKLSIKVFDLSFSEITEVNFLYFPRADKIDLSSNKIISVTNCQLLDTLTLNLTDNRIKIIDENFETVSKLYLGHNFLENLNKSVFGDLESVLELDLGFNRMPNYVQDFFHDLTSLRSLKLAHNSIVKIETIFFRDLTSLTILDLSQNQIEEFQFGVFDGLRSLQFLDISDNKLLDLHQYSFHSLSNLISLRFDNNRISSFDIGDLKNYLPCLETISLNGNPWNCKDLAKIFKSFHAQLQRGQSYDVENLNGIACSNSKKNLQGNNTSAVSFDEMIGNIQRAINEGISKSKIDNFFNDGFENSKFLRYFEKDYGRSNFFKYFNNFKFFVKNSEGFNESKAEKLTELQVPNDSNNSILVFSVVMQVLMSSLLLCIVYLMFSFVRKRRVERNPELSSQMELC